MINATQDANKRNKQTNASNKQMQPTDKNIEFDLFQKTLRYIKAKKQMYTRYEASITSNHTFDCTMVRTLQFTFHYMYMVECTHVRRTPFSIWSNIRKFYNLHILRRRVRPWSRLCPTLWLLCPIDWVWRWLWGRRWWETCFNHYLQLVTWARSGK